MTITLRAIKGVPLTTPELDGNFTDLDGRVTSAASAASSAASGLATHSASNAAHGIPTLQTAITALQAAVAGLTTNVVSFNTTITFTGKRDMGVRTLTGATAFTPNMAGAIRDGYVQVTLVGNGSVVPTFSGFTKDQISGDFDVSGPNDVFFFFNGYGSVPSYAVFPRAAVSGTPTPPAPTPPAPTPPAPTPPAPTPPSPTPTPPPPADITAPTVTARAVANATPTRVTYTFSEPMDQTSAPAGSAFSTSGHTVAGNFVWVDSTHGYHLVTAAFVNGETARTESYTVPGSNPLKDLAGNSLVGFSGAAIVNNVASSGAGQVIRLETISNTAKIQESANGSAWDYMGIGSPPPALDEQGVCTGLTLAASAAGKIRFEVGVTGGSNYGAIGFSTTATNNAYVNWIAMVIYTGNYVGFQNNVAAGSGSARASTTGDVLEVERAVDGTLTVSYSSDAGATFNLIDTLTTPSTAKLWIHGTVGGNGAIKNLRGDGLS